MFDKVGSCELCGWIDDIEKMMGDIPPVFRWDFICPDIKTSVYLHGIAVNDFPIELYG